MKLKISTVVHPWTNQAVVNHLHYRSSKTCSYNGASWRI